MLKISKEVIRIRTSTDRQSHNQQKRNKKTKNDIMTRTSQKTGVNSDAPDRVIRKWIVELKLLSDTKENINVNLLLFCISERLIKYSCRRGISIRRFKWLNPTLERQNMLHWPKCIIVNEYRGYNECIIILFWKISSKIANKT